MVTSSTTSSLVPINWISANSRKSKSKKIVIADSVASEGLQLCAHSLVGKLYSDKPVKLFGMRKTLSEAWDCDGLQMYQIKELMFQFLIPLEEDSERILRNYPWSFDGDLLSIQQWVPEFQFYPESFRSVPFWIRITNVPLDLMTEGAPKELASSFLTCEKVEVHDLGFAGGRYIRIRVCVDVSKPFRRGLRIVHEGKRKWTKLRYERLPSLCYFCGRVGHAVRCCPSKLDSDPIDDRQFGCWLKASGLVGKLLKNQKGSSSANSSFGPLP
ncbi:uncharacterized protein LOC132314648 [Cornus florida]|uniref:uncharacterized protein LOC132314648 n=1 Tax=Cornus florida TaxID=4283 RepID=UPI002899541B|nr:uncharacterized protein LOC132314648 [Cornus florida]